MQLQEELKKALKNVDISRTNEVEIQMLYGTLGQLDPDLANKLLDLLKNEMYKRITIDQGAYEETQNDEGI